MQVSPEAPDAPDAPPTPAKRLWRGLILAILGLYLLLAYAYVWTIQPGYGPDEPRHLAFVRRLVTRGQLPRVTNGQEEDGAIALHPPLYYAAVSPIYAATRGLGDQAANRIIKHLSPLVLLGALLLFLGALKRLFPDRPFVIVSALAAVALLPEYLLEASVMNNDCFAVLFGALLLWYLVRTWDEGPSLRTAVLAGLIMAASVNSKATGWLLTPLWALALLLRARAQGGRKGAWLRDFFAAYGVLLLLGTWWYARNYSLYGKLVPIEFEYLGRSLKPYDLRTGEPLSPLQVYSSGYVLNWGWRAVEGLFQSYWSQIDWLREDYRIPVWGACLALVLAAAAGWVLRLLPWAARLRKGAPTRASACCALRPTLLLLPMFAVPWLATWYTATFLHIGFYQGSWYLMPVSFAAAALLAVGWERLCPRRLQAPAVIGLAVALLAFNAVCLNELITVLNPKYVTP